MSVCYWHVLIKYIMMMIIIIILSDIVKQFTKLTGIFTGINRTLLPWKKKKMQNNFLYIMSVYHFVAFDTLFMYLFIYSLIFFYSFFIYYASRGVTGIVSHLW